VYVSAGFDPITGRRRRLSGTAPTKKEAQLLEAELTVRAAAMTDKTTTATVETAAEAWWLSKPQVAATTLASYRYMLDVHILPTLGERRLDEIRPRLIRSWLDHLADKGLSPASARKARTVLSSLMSWCVSMEMCDDNPVMKVPPPALDPEPRGAATVDEFRRLLDLADDDLADYLWLAMETGGRRGETLGVRWCDLDLDAGTITLRQSVTTGLDGVQIRSHGKKKQGRTIAISTVTAERMRARRDRIEKMWADAGGELDPAGLVFSGGRGSRRHPLDGQPWQPRSVTAAFGRLKERAGVRPEVDLHGLRRGMVSELLAAGVDPRTVMGRAGHSSSRMTMETYARVRDTADAAAAELLGQLLGQEPAPAKGERAKK
jgi:integrase